MTIAFDDGVRRYFVDPASVGPVSLEDFVTALELGQAAYDWRLPVADQRKKRILVDMGDGREVALRFTNHPMNRMMQGIKDYCGRDTDRFMRLAMRLFAFQDLYHSGVLAEWVLDDPADKGARLFHEALFEVAAGHPLTMKAQFDSVSFVEAVTVAAARIDADAPCGEE